MKIQFLFLLLLLLPSCRIGNIGGDENQSSSIVTTDNSEENGISECVIECKPVEGGWEITRTCSGQIQDGPDFAADLPDGCAWPPEEDEDGETQA